MRAFQFDEVCVWCVCGVCVCVKFRWYMQPNIHCALLWFYLRLSNRGFPTQIPRRFISYPHNLHSQRIATPLFRHTSNLLLACTRLNYKFPRYERSSFFQVRSRHLLISFFPNNSYLYVTVHRK